MKMTLPRRALLAWAAAPAGLASAAGDEAPPDLLQALEAYDRATTAKDVAALGELIAEDYLLVNSDASLQNKAEYLSDFLRADLEIDPYVIEQPMHRAWGDAAVTGGRLRLSWAQDGERHQRLLHIAHVWRRQERWRIGYTQLTRVL